MGLKLVNYVSYGSHKDKIIIKQQVHENVRLSIQDQYSRVGVLCIPSVLRKSKHDLQISFPQHFTGFIIEAESAANAT